VPLTSGQRARGYLHHHLDTNQTLEARKQGALLISVLRAGKKVGAPEDACQTPHEEDCWVVTPGPQKIPLVLRLRLLQKQESKTNVGYCGIASTPRHSLATTGAHPWYPSCWLPRSGSNKSRGRGEGVPSAS